ncbi:GNAT family N-acetyltransferase [bacterium]|nr:MAG: GNAT family N-acetyltransferase [bacterium]
METSAPELEKNHSPLLLKKIETIPDFLAIRDRWEGLLSQSGSESIFLTWEWVYNWWLVYREKRELFIVTVENACGDLLGIAPLLSRKIRLPAGNLNLLEFLGTGEKRKDEVCSEFLDFIAPKGREEEVMKAIFDYLLNNTSRWDILNLQSLLNNANILKHISGKKNKKLLFWKASNNGRGYNYLDFPEGECADINFRKKRFQKTLKNILKHGEVRARLCDSEASLAEDMRSLIRLHQLRWNSAGRPGCFSSLKFNEFHQRLARHLLLKGRLALQLLEVNDEAVACEYCFEYNRRLFIYQSGFNPRLYKNASLGHLSMAYLMEGALARGIKKAEFLRGEEAYKEKWSKDKRLAFNIVIARKNLKGIIYIAIRTAFENMKQLGKGIARKIRKVK